MDTTSRAEIAQAEQAASRVLDDGRGLWNLRIEAGDDASRQLAPCEQLEGPLFKALTAAFAMASRYSEAHKAVLGELSIWYECVPEAQTVPHPFAGDTGVVGAFIAHRYELFRWDPLAKCRRKVAVVQVRVLNPDPRDSTYD